MKSNISAPVPAGAPLNFTLPPLGLGERWTRFWLSPVSPLGLHALRVLAGLLFLFWLLPLAGQRHALFGLEGWYDRDAYVAESRLPPAADPEEAPPPRTWSFLFLTVDRPELLDLAYWGAIAVLVLFTLGILTRLTGVLTWLVVASFLANPVTRHGADYLLGILAFYLMIGYLLLGLWSRRLSPAEALLGPRGTALLAPLLGNTSAANREPSHAARVALRLLQVHFAIIVVTSALHKLQFGSWWAGVALWFPMHPPFETTPESLKAESVNAGSLLFFLSLTQYLVLAWQLGFPLFAWRRSWRIVLLGGAALGWLGCLLMTKQPLYGPVYFVAALSYLTPAEWHWLADRLRQGASRAAGSPPRELEKKLQIGVKS